MVQDRIRQKNWLRDQGYPVGALPRHLFGRGSAAGGRGAGAADLSQAGPGRLRRPGPGEAGRPQGSGCGDAWRALGEQPCVAEQALRS